MFLVMIGAFQDSTGMGSVFGEVTEVRGNLNTAISAEAGKRVVLVLDNASWHKSKSLEWHHIEAKFLPAYSADFNPIERLWLHLKTHHLADFLTKCGGELSDKLFDFVSGLLEVLRSACSKVNDRLRNGLNKNPPRIYFPAAGWVF